MNRRFIRTAVLLAAAAVVAGCGAEVADGPPEVHLGLAECVHCGMIVSDPRTAAVLIAEVEGKRRDLAFDDIGDMIAYEGERQELRVLRRYVGDFATGQWVPTADASLVRSDRIHTPMGSGIIAFADRAAAERKRAEVGGETLSYPHTALTP